MTPASGFLCLVLHAHLPYVRHPEFGESYEERWLYEAILESYLPLLDTFERLAEEGVRFRVALSLSATLLEMLHDDLHRQRFLRYVDSRIHLAEQELQRTSHQHHELRPSIEMYHERFQRFRRLYLDCHQGDLTSAFGRLADQGHLELLTTAATHGYLPLLEPNEQMVRGQVQVGLEAFQRLTGRSARGFWLPECGYRRGLDVILAEAGLDYCILDTPSLVGARPRPRFAGFAPIRTERGLTCFGRDLEGGLEVWSSLGGYPADPEYRDFYRDIGWDLPLDYVGSYVHESGKRLNTGLKYYRITGPTDHKEAYRPGEAAHVAERHASAFLSARQRQVEWLRERMGQPPVVVAAFDAELFGHWWLEGPLWLEHLLRKLATQGQGLESITPTAYLREAPLPQISEPNPGSWGDGGFNARWLNPSNDWVYRHLSAAGQRMVEMARRGDGEDPDRKRLLNQAARELLLSQSSDWAYLMSTGQFAEYARKRTRDHLVAFNLLYDEFREGKVDPEVLRNLEERSPLFRNLDYRAWR
jgi:1,4-alpha-glucan branching enzyme